MEYERATVCYGVEYIEYARVMAWYGMVRYDMGWSVWSKWRME